MLDEHTNDSYPRLTPVMSAWMRRVLENASLIDQLLAKNGSPLNLLCQAPFADNYHAYKRVLNEHGLKHKIFFARKANPSPLFVQAAHRVGMGVDTASYRELKESLQLGCDSENVVLTAAVKNEDLLRLALRHQVLIIIDNEDECRRVNRLAGELGIKPVIGIRISGFCVKGDKLYSRFGFDVDHVTSFITQHLAEKYRHVRFGGFHFHLDGYAIHQRAEALRQTIACVDKLKEQGTGTSFIDMGGGLLTNYLTKKTEWQTFWDQLKRALKGQRNPITFGNNGLGYEMLNGKLIGEPDVYPYYNETPKAQFLEAVLSSKKDETSIARLLKARDIELRMEPGRSLLDQAGMSVSRVVHRKKDQHGDWLVGLQMNGGQLCSSSADFLVDPVHIPMNAPTAEETPTPVYLTGGFCLEQDVILKRKIVFARLPQAGDIIAFPNTAGYMMHFYETESHLFPKAVDVEIKRNNSPKIIKPLSEDL